MVVVIVACTRYAFDASRYVAVTIPCLTAPRVSELGLLESPDVRVHTGWTQVVEPSEYGFESPDVFVPQSATAAVDTACYGLSSPEVTVLNRTGAVVPVEASEMAMVSRDAVVKIPCRVMVGVSTYGRRTT